MPLTGEAKREYQRNWLRQRRDAWFAGKTCVSCGTSANLQLDHKDPTKKVSHNVWSWRQERRDAELANCQTMCESCHRRKTNRGRQAPHGTHNRYVSGCRCTRCRAGHTASTTAWKRSKGNGTDAEGLEPSRP